MAPNFCDFFYSPASTNFWYADYKAMSLLKSVTTTSYGYGRYGGGGGTGTFIICYSVIFLEEVYWILQIF